MTAAGIRPLHEAPSTGAAGHNASVARVLLVDDSDVVRDVSRALLEDAGVRVDEAGDGAAALQWLREHDAACNLILMDVQMPVLDGLAATRALRAEWGERAPPVVAVTAHVSDEEKQRCREAGMVDHLRKPLDPAQLVATLNRWLAPGEGHVTSAPAPLPDAGQLQTLPDVPGFDLKAGLVCVGGNVDRLRAMLGRFGTTYAGVVSQLHAQLKVDQHREAHRLAHTLKGAAATVGGAAIAGAADALERAVAQTLAANAADGGAARARDTAWPELAQLETALQAALPALLEMKPAALDGDATNNNDAPLPESAGAEYEALRQLLAGNCYAARKAFVALRDRLGAGDVAWQAAGAAVDALDFQRALTQLDERYPANAGKRPAP